MRDTSPGPSRLRCWILTFMVLCLIVGNGCSPDNLRQPRADTELLAAHPDTGLELRTASRKDTVAPGEKLELLYLVVNGPSSREFVNNPDWFSFQIERDDGSSVAPTTSSSVTRTWGDRVKLMLPANAILGQLVDLACVEPGYGSTGGRASCEYSYDLTEPGTYRIITVYERPLAGIVETRLVDTAQVVVRSPT